jgi:hypothetical protein
MTTIGICNRILPVFHVKQRQFPAPFDCFLLKGALGEGRPFVTWPNVFHVKHWYLTNQFKAS